MLNRVQQYTKIFELLDIDDFSLHTAKKNADKCKALYNRWFNDNDERWKLAMELYHLFDAAYMSIE